MVNIDLIPRDRPCAIWCESKEEADEFFAFMVEHYPQKCKNWRKGSQWTEDFSHYNPGFYRNQPLRFDRHGYYVREGYEIIRFSDICVGDELHESEQSIELLFGLEG